MAELRLREELDPPVPDFTENALLDAETDVAIMRFALQFWKVSDFSLSLSIYLSLSLSLPLSLSLFFFYLFLCLSHGIASWYLYLPIYFIFSELPLSSSFLLWLRTQIPCLSQHWPWILSIFQKEKVNLLW